ncbi:MAG: hypothetical protein COU27_02290, partial [Candidatus Levybacteria bacterium CG10_big_fil_rev_8_21_14_0_10_36_7]
MQTLTKTENWVEPDWEFLEWAWDLEKQWKESMRKEYPKTDAELIKTFRPSRQMFKEKILEEQEKRELVVIVIKKKLTLTKHQISDEFSQWFWREWTESTLNKVDALLADHRMRHIFTLPKSSFNLREIINNQKILLVKLEKGRLKGSADLLGSLLLSKIKMAAFARTDIPKEKRAPFYLYIDEFQNFASK